MAEMERRDERKPEHEPVKRKLTKKQQTLPPLERRDEPRPTHAR